VARPSRRYRHGRAVPCFVIGPRDLIETVAETGSTNAHLAARIAAGEAVDEGHWLVADRQTAGRGRQGRVWSDGTGNFMGSTLVRLRASDPPAHTLSLVAGLAAAQAVDAAAPRLPGLALKWPNDLLLGEAKLAGILLERVGDTVIVGIGVNLVEAPQVEGRATASLASAGHRVMRDDFAVGIEHYWQTALALWHGGEWDGLRAGWTRRALPIGTPLAVHGADGALQRGTFAGIDAEGALQLDLAGGTRRTIHAGEVLLDRR
jgi:BirA family biotin operon repressor/biotin-[acetyl-CoA-carboxylase] ligase